MVGSVSGPAIGRCFCGLFDSIPNILIGPCIGGVVVTFTAWRIIFWLQVGMAGAGLICAVVFLPKFRDQNSGNGRRVRHSPLAILSMFNPMNIFKLLLYPNVLFAVSRLLFSSQKR